jgi:hypothetical protein
MKGLLFFVLRQEVAATSHPPHAGAESSASTAAAADNDNDPNQEDNKIPLLPSVVSSSSSRRGERMRRMIKSNRNKTANNNGTDNSNAKKKKDGVDETALALLPQKQAMPASAAAAASSSNHTVTTSPHAATASATVVTRQQQQTPQLRLADKNCSGDILSVATTEEPATLSSFSDSCFSVTPGGEGSNDDEDASNLVRLSSSGEKTATGNVSCSCCNSTCCLNERENGLLPQQLVSDDDGASAAATASSSSSRHLKEDGRGGSIDSIDSGCNSTSTTKTNNRRRKVTFGMVHIHEFGTGLGDNPGCTGGGPPVCLEYTVPVGSYHVPVDSYESSMPQPRRKGLELRVPPDLRRAWILISLSSPSSSPSSTSSAATTTTTVEDDMAAAERAVQLDRNRRMRSIALQDMEHIVELCEGIVRKFRKATLRNQNRGRRGVAGNKQWISGGGRRAVAPPGTVEHWHATYKEEKKQAKMRQRLERKKAA